eukprot:TRINITY_DN11528_c0_g1_i1.p1 TRINITY_DN11528_c0_g1~~TRINITY_DN11528_c0_g1_i1.p1  ORF type:complete len:462 (-),score=81.11 TRINITY_DN11528_c0_g1_i1:68-1429(-)
MADGNIASMKRLKEMKKDTFQPIYCISYYKNISKVFESNFLPLNPLNPACISFWSLFLLLFQNFKFISTVPSVIIEKEVTSFDCWYFRFVENILTSSWLTDLILLIFSILLFLSGNVISIIFSLSVDVLYCTHYLKLHPIFLFPVGMLIFFGKLSYDFIFYRLSKKKIALYSSTSIFVTFFSISFFFLLNFLFEKFLDFYSFNSTSLKILYVCSTIEIIFCLFFYTYIQCEKLFVVFSFTIVRKFILFLHITFMYASALNNKNFTDERIWYDISVKVFLTVRLMLSIDSIYSLSIIDILSTNQKIKNKKRKIQKNRKLLNFLWERLKKKHESFLIEAFFNPLFEFILCVNLIIFASQAILVGKILKYLNLKDFKSIKLGCVIFFASPLKIFEAPKYYNVLKVCLSIYYFIISLNVKKVNHDFFLNSEFFVFILLTPLTQLFFCRLLFKRTAKN